MFENPGQLDRPATGGVRFGIEQQFGATIVWQATSLGPIKVDEAEPKIGTLV
jgi:hypothetical protein